MTDTPYIDVRFHFTEFVEDGEVDYYDVRSVQRIGTNIPQSAMQGIGEVLGQSDRWCAGSVGGTLDAMCDPDERERDLKDYW